MKMANFIERKIRGNAAVKVNYRSDFDGLLHYIKGYLIGETEQFFQVEGGRYHDLVAVPKSGVVSMFFEEPKDQKPKLEIKTDPVISRSPSEQDKKFSYDRWWREADNE